MSKVSITIAKGDGIGPEIMDAVLMILNAAKVPLQYEEVEIGEKVFLKGHKAGITAEIWNKILATKAFLKAPVTTPQGGGFKSLNVTIRTTLGLFANVRPCISYFPFVKTKHPEMDVVIIRENEEDLYTGIEYQQTPHTCESIKLITRDGCERIIRFAFEYAKKYNRKKVTCFTKDNIMKISDGLFHKIFEEIAQKYPDIIKEHWIVDIGAAKLADTPEVFDVIVMPNLYGDILSDVAAQISGSVGLCGSANIGEKYSMFEAIHGSAPRRAGQNIANPTGLLFASISMLVHLNLTDHATRIHNALLKTLEEGFHTYDIFKENTSKQKVGTKEFAQKIIENFEKKPTNLQAVSYKESASIPFFKVEKKRSSRILVGIDVFIFAEGDFRTFFDEISHVNVGPMHLKLITNRGVKIWPDGLSETYLVDHWRLRFLSSDFRAVSVNDVIHIQQILDRIRLDIIKTENLYLFEGQPAFSHIDT